MRRFLAAAAAYPIGRPAHFDDYAQTLTDWTARAAAGGARLLVYPEYAAMELASLFGPDIEGDLRAQIDVISGLLPQVDALHAALAAQHGVSNPEYAL